MYPSFLLGGENMNSETQRLRRKVKAREIGQLCKYYREQEHLSVREIANKQGYLPQTVYAFESGSSNSSILLFDCYFNVLKMSTQQQLYKAIKECLK